MSGESPVSKSADNSSDRFTYQGKELSRQRYLGQRELGPLEDQFIECPKCSTPIHKFAIRCMRCGVQVREIGKIDSGPRGSATKGIAFVVGVLLFAMSAMVLGDRGTAYYTLPSVIGMGIASFVLGVNGLLGLLYFHYFVGPTFLRGLLAFGLGAASLIVAVLLLILMI
jgi:hypothetical protein